MVNSENRGILVLFEPGKAETLIEVGEKPLTIGRSRHNDITLKANGVSKRHATIRCTERGWVVADLGSTNGTQLNGRRLPAHKPFPWRLGQVVRIATYEFEFRLNPLAIQNAATTPKTDPSMPLVSTQTRPAALRRSDVVPAPVVATTPRLVPTIDIALPSSSKHISIGEYHTVQVEVTNQGPAAATITLVQDGLPLTWVTMPYRHLQLDPGQTKALTVAFHPPATELSQPGRYEVELKAVDADGKAWATVSTRLTVSETGRFHTQIKPNSKQGNRRGQLLIQNSVNSQAKFQLYVTDSDSHLSLADSSSITLRGREKRVMDYALYHSRRPLIGRPQELPYALTIQGPAGQQHHNATYMVEPVIPFWLLSIAAVLVMMLFVSGLLVVNNWELFNEQFVASLAGMLENRPDSLLLNWLFLKSF